jgi:hypothetical protein
MVLARETSRWLVLGGGRNKIAAVSSCSVRKPSAQLTGWFKGAHHLSRMQKAQKRRLPSSSRGNWASRNFAWLSCQRKPVPCISLIPSLAQIPAIGGEIEFQVGARRLTENRKPGFLLIQRNTRETNGGIKRLHSRDIGQ